MPSHTQHDFEGGWAWENLNDGSVSVIWSKFCTAIHLHIEILSLSSIACILFHLFTKHLNKSVGKKSTGKCTGIY